MRKRLRPRLVQGRFKPGRRWSSSPYGGRRQREDALDLIEQAFTNFGQAFSQRGFDSSGAVTFSILGLVKLHEISSKPAFILTVPSATHPTQDIVRSHLPRPRALAYSPNTLEPCWPSSGGGSVILAHPTICKSRRPISMSAALILSKYRHLTDWNESVGQHVRVARRCP
jgi:hypothetical protein